MRFYGLGSPNVSCVVMTTSLSNGSIGRPRRFEPEAALQAALDVFWQQGYQATSLDDLTAAMRLNRSSFYGTFGSKQAVLHASLRMYADWIYGALQACARSEPDPVKAARAMLDRMANPFGDESGCLLVNSITELAPGDAELGRLARMQIDRVGALLASLLTRAGFTEAVAGSRAAALISCAFGATVMRKAGLPGASVAAMLAQADALLEAPGSE